ncbi:MAG TPA: sensor histidine kinase [Clostridiaceae bacterium]|nr:sensor histidine kinase [Clostridiaceae bacterium]
MLKNIKNRIVNASLRKKFLVLTMLISIVPITFIGYFSYWISASYLQESIIDASIARFEAINLRMDRFLSAIDELSLEILASNSVQRLLKNSDITKYYVFENETRSLLRSTLSTRKQIHSIAVFNKNGDIIVFESNVDFLGTDAYRFTKKNVQTYDVYPYVEEIKGNRIWTKLYKDSDLISMIRNINEIGTQNQIGTILINIFERNLANLVENSEMKKGWELIILEQFQNVVYQTGDNILAPEDIGDLNDISGHRIIDIKGKRYLGAFYTSRFNDWRMILLMPTSSLFSGLNIIKGTTVLIILLCLVLLSIFLFFMSAYLVMPIIKLSHLMKEAEKGDLDVKFEAKYHDEIGALGKSFNSMLETLKNLMKQNTEKQKILRAQELKVLQMQINPHFLYNTIDTINWMAQSINADQISEVAIALANYYRQSLSKGAEIIKISEEISQIKSYLTIQKIRYAGYIDFKIIIDDNIMELYIPKLTLQPIVENAIYHGLREKDGGGIVEIRGYKEGDHVVFHIKDNGKGMDEKTLKKLKESINRGISSKGYGLSNVNERLKLYFGEEFGISVESIWESYTLVTVRIPSVENVDDYAKF